MFYKIWILYDKHLRWSHLRHRRLSIYKSVVKLRYCYFFFGKNLSKKAPELWIRQCHRTLKCIWCRRRARGYGRSCQMHTIGDWDRNARPLGLASDVRLTWRTSHHWHLFRHLLHTVSRSTSLQNSHLWWADEHWIRSRPMSDARVALVLSDLLCSANGLYCVRWSVCEHRKVHLLWTMTKALTLQPNED